MSTLLENSKSAERERGCVFAESFKNVSKVIENGGTISGTPLINNVATFNGTSDKIEYNPINNIKSIVMQIKLNSTTEDVLKLSSSHSITTSSGTLTATGLSSPTYYIDGDNTQSIGTSWVWVAISTSTSFNADDIQLSYVSSYGEFQIKNLKFFTKELNDDELKDYSAGADFWNYEDDAIFIYDCKTDGYDITNKKILDKSGNGRDANLGDGSTVSTFPTKLEHAPAYEFDGSNDYIDYSDETFPDGTEGTIYVMANVLDNSGSVRIWSTNDSNGGNYEFRTYSTSGDNSDLSLLIPIGAAGSPLTNNISDFRFNQIQTLTNTWSYESPTTTAKAYRNGVLEDTDTTNNTVRPPNNAFEGGKWGSDYSRIQLFYMAGWIKPLTQIQIIDLHLKLFRRINKI